MSFELPKLPYAFDALEPHIDARTMEIHHDKHHKGYTDKLNSAIEGTDKENKSIEDILITAFFGRLCPQMVVENQAVNLQKQLMTLLVVLMHLKRNSLMLQKPNLDLVGLGYACIKEVNWR